MGHHNFVCNSRPIIFLSILTGHIPAKIISKYMVGIPRYGFPWLNWDFLPDSPSDMAIQLMAILTGWGITRNMYHSSRATRRPLVGGLWPWTYGWPGRSLLVWLVGVVVIACTKVSGSNQSNTTLSARNFLGRGMHTQLFSCQLSHSLL